MKKLLGVLLVIFMVAGCGGGGGSDAPPEPETITPPTPETITPPTQDVTGTYTLSSFEVYFFDGSTVTPTSPLVTSYSGTWYIRPDFTTTQIVTLNDQTTTINATWRVNVSTGLFEFVTTEGLASELVVTASGNVLTTYLNSVAGGFEEYDYWTKTSDSVTATPQAVSMSLESETLDTFQGQELGALVVETIDLLEGY